jgi:hypothetical protein
MRLQQAHICYNCGCSCRCWLEFSFRYIFFLASLSCGLQIKKLWSWKGSECHSQWIRRDSILALSSFMTCRTALCLLFEMHRKCAFWCKSMKVIYKWLGFVCNEKLERYLTCQMERGMWKINTQKWKREGKKIE